MPPGHNFRKHMLLPSPALEKMVFKPVMRADAVSRLPIVINRRSNFPMLPNFQGHLLCRWASSLFPLYEIREPLRLY